MALQYRSAKSGIDVMQATSVRWVLYALLACTFGGAPANAAGVVASGDETAGTTDTIQRQDTGAVAEKGKRDAANPPGRLAQPAALQHEGAHSAMHDHGSLSVAHVYVSKRAIGATVRTYVIRRPAATMGAVRSNGPMSALAATRRPSSGVVRGANLPIAGLNPAARDGVIGAARASGRGTIGGPANTGSVIKAGIDGAMLRRRS